MTINKYKFYVLEIKLNQTTQQSPRIFLSSTLDCAINTGPIWHVVCIPTSAVKSHMYFILPPLNFATTLPTFQPTPIPTNCDICEKSIRHLFNFIGPIICINIKKKMRRANALDIAITPARMGIWFSIEMKTNNKFKLCPDYFFIEQKFDIYIYKI